MHFVNVIVVGIQTKLSADICEYSVFTPYTVKRKKKMEHEGLSPDLGIVASGHWGLCFLSSPSSPVFSYFWESYTPDWSSSRNVLWFLWGVNADTQARSSSCFSDPLTLYTIKSPGKTFHLFPLLTFGLIAASKENSEYKYFKELEPCQTTRCRSPLLFLSALHTKQTSWRLVWEQKV